MVLSETTDQAPPPLTRAEWFKQCVSLPFDDFMLRAHKFHGDESQANYDSGYRSELFYFVWLVRGHPTMEPYRNNAKEALKRVESHLSEWSKSARQQKRTPIYGKTKPVDSWMEWFGVASPDAKAEFIDVWNKSRFLPGHDPVEQAIDANRAVRVLVPDDVVARRPVADRSERSEQDYEFFVGVAGHLQVAVGGSVIKLPCAKFAEKLGLSKMTISRYRRWAQEDGFLKVVKKHTFRSKGTGDATEFRFDVSRWGALRNRASAAAGESFAAAPNLT